MIGIRSKFTSVNKNKKGPGGVYFASFVWKWLGLGTHCQKLVLAFSPGPNQIQENVYGLCKNNMTVVCETVSTLKFVFYFS